MAVRLKDIAAMANVSVAAVSRVLNDKPIRISEKKRREIKDLAQKYNYSPNIVAKGLATHQTNTIALIVPDISNPFFSSLAKEVEDALRQEGYLLILVNSDDQFESELALVDLLLNRGLDALILALSTEAYQQKEKMKQVLAKIDVPFVLVDRGIDDYQCNQVFFNNRQGGYLATKHLLEMGHRKIGTMMNPEKYMNSYYRYQGYLDAMKEFNAPVSEAWNVACDYKYQEAFDRAELLFKQKELTAVFAGNDMIALGIKKRAKTFGLRVPEDFSLVGYDNLAFNQLLDRPLTSIEQNVSTLAQHTVAVLLAALKKSSAPQFIQLAPKLIEQESVEKILTTG